MTFDLRYLKAFVSVAEYGSLGRAAEALHITQPALSRTIKQLESQLSSTLFERHSKGMQLTSIGQAFYPHAILLQKQSAIAQEEVNALLGLTKGTIRVGAVGSIASLLLPQAVSHTLQKWPGLKVEILEGVWDRLAESLLKYEIDIALSTFRPDSDEIITIADCHWQDDCYIVSSPEHPLQHKVDLCLQDTLLVPWAIPPKGTEPFEQMRHAFAKQGLGLPNVVVETRSVTSLKSLVARSGFLSWMPEPMFLTESKADAIKRLMIVDAMGKRHLTAFRRRHGLLPSPALKLLEELKRLTAEKTI